MVSSGCASSPKKKVRRAAVVAVAAPAAGAVMVGRAKSKAKDKVTPDRDLRREDEDRKLRDGGLRD